MAVAITQDEVGKLTYGTHLMVVGEGQLVDVTSYYGVGLHAVRAADETREMQAQRDAYRGALERVVAMYPQPYRDNGELMLAIATARALLADSAGGEG